jgi:hypothetical protein
MGIYGNHGRNFQRVRMEIALGYLLGLRLDPEYGEARSAETSENFYQTSRCHIPDDSTILLIVI